MESSGGTFGAKLKRLRTSRGLSQEAVARQLTERYPSFAISQASISHLERRMDPPRMEVLNILADYYRVPVAYFIDVSVESYEARKPQIASYLQDLRNRSHMEGAVILHTDDNSSGDKETLDTTHNLSSFYRNTDIHED